MQPIRKFYSALPDLIGVFQRFPVSVLVAAGICIYWNMKLPNFYPDFPPVIAAGIAAFLSSGATHLFAESRRLSWSVNMLLAGIAGLIFGAFGYFTETFNTSYLLLFTGLIGMLMVSTTLRPDGSQGAIWFFNLRLWLAALLAIVVSIVFILGLWSIVAALNFLLEVPIPNTWDDHIWVTALALVGPIFGLSMVPRDLDEEIDIVREKGTLLERGISVLVNYVLVPIVVAYALILHAYAAKIVIGGELPRGQIATIVSTFAVVGTAAWLVAWPWRDTGTQLLRLFVKGWFFLTFAPTILLGIAIWRRIADHGITPDRYGIVLIAVWIGFVTAYLALRRNKADMRFIMGSIAALLLVGSVTPYGAYGLTLTDQTKRLLQLLEANGGLKDGKAVRSEKLLPSDVAGKGYSILQAIEWAGGLQRLRPLFEGSERDPFKIVVDDWRLTSAIGAFLGFNNEYSGVSFSLAPDAVRFDANVPLPFDVAKGGRVIGPIQATESYVTAEQKPLTAIYDGKTLVIKLETERYTVPLEKLFEKVKAEADPASSAQKPVTIEIAPGVTIAITSLFSNPNEKGAGLVGFWIIQQQSP